MSTEATLIAVGKYHKDITPYLEYPSYWYDDVPDGAPIATRVLLIKGKDRCFDFAEAVGLRGHTDMANHIENTMMYYHMHHIADVDWLTESEIDRILALMNAGFDCYFMVST